MKSEPKDDAQPSDTNDPLPTAQKSPDHPVSISARQRPRSSHTQSHPHSKTPSDAPLLPHTASSAISTATTIATSAASTVKSAVDEALAWTEAKVETLSAKAEDGTGPYGSVSTCAPSDLDAIGQGVLPGMPPVVEKGEGEGEEQEGGGMDGGEGEERVSEEKKGAQRDEEKE